MKLSGAFIAILAVMLSGCGTDRKKEAQHELERAATALKQGSTQAAISHLGTSLAKEPSAQAYQLRAEAQIDPSRFQRAMEDAEAGLKLDPKNLQLRHIYSVSAACLKLVQGEASIVDNVRYKSAQPHMAHIEPLFGQPSAETGELDDDEPFWKKRRSVQEDTYIQGLIEMNDAFWKQDVPQSQPLLERGYR